MRVLIVGSNGYIGSNLIKHFVCKGIEVIAGSRNVILNNSHIENLRYVAINLREPNTYRYLLNEIDSIVYLAGPGGALREQLTSNLIQDHLLNLSIFLEENQKNRNCPIVFASSGGTIYGRGNGLPFKENDPLDPINPYGLLKLMSEQMLRYYNRNKETPYIAMRISNPYGGIAHSKLDQGVINIFVKKSMAGEPVEIWGDGSAVRDYIYMPDLMEAFHAAIKSENFVGPINIGGGVGLSLSELCGLIESNSRSMLLKNFRQGNSLLINYAVLDISLASNALGWKPSFSIENGLSNMFLNMDKAK